MLVLFRGILGFQSFLFAFIFFMCLLIRHKWRNGVAKKEEILRLVEMASKEAAMVEIEASADYTSLPVPRLHQCALCFRPTTLRCSKCKAVRYCSSGCQIMHWRQGHKDECCPPSDTAFIKEKSKFGRVEVSKSTEEADAGFAPVYDYPSSCFGPEAAESKPYTDNSHNRLANPIPRNTANDTCASVTATHVDDREREPTTFYSESVPLGTSEVKIIHACKRDKENFSPNGEAVVSKSPYHKTKSVQFHDVTEDLGSKKSSRRAAMLEKLSASDHKILPSMNYSNSDSLHEEAEKESRQHEHKESRSSSAGANDCKPLSNGGDLDLSSKSSKMDSYDALPAKVKNIPILTHNVRNGLKSSAQKVFHPFRGSKESKSNIPIAGSEMIFPYGLFAQLYCHDDIQLSPFGLTNCGNSCYANAVLQCLAYTRPFTSYLLQGLHSRQCRKKGWCLICEFQCLLLKAKEGVSPLSPIGIISKLHKIGSHLGPGREEDAHEFLRCAVETMQSVCLKEAGVLGPLAEETTIIGQAFGGYLRSKIKCLKCLGKSERYERMMDLNVEIEGDIGSLEEALAQFTAPEILEKDNKYKCGRCKSYERARKKLTVIEAPNILTIVLKRFQSGNFDKLNKSIQFPEVLNMAPYMSDSSDKSPLYNLYAVVVHLDVMNAAFSGHYVCYIKSFQGEWFRIDDSMVEPVELQRVLLERAYMLLYARQSPKYPASISKNITSQVGKFKRISFEAVSSSLPKSKSLAASASSFLSRPKHGKHPYKNIDGTSWTESPYPEEWRFHNDGRIVDSSGEGSSTFSMSDASSCSTASTKDSASTADFTDYIFGELGSDWYRHYGFSCDSIASSSYPGSGANPLGATEALRKHPQDSDGEDDSAVLCANLDRNHYSCRETDLRKFAFSNHHDKNTDVHLRRVSRDRSSAQTFC